VSRERASEQRGRESRESEGTRESESERDLIRPGARPQGPRSHDHGTAHLPASQLRPGSRPRGKESKDRPELQRKTGLADADNGAPAKTPEVP
jgi:hypothetical protein